MVGQDLPRSRRAGEAHAHIQAPGEFRQGCCSFRDERTSHRERRSRGKRNEYLLDSIDGIVWEGDPATFRFSFVSKRAETLLGYPVAEWLEAPGAWVRHLHPDDREQTIRSCAVAVPAAKDQRARVTRMIAADGRTVWLRDRVKVVVEAGVAVKLPAGSWWNVTAPSRRGSTASGAGTR